ncbi:MAG: hypothetical protein AB1679_12745 [Actinomycetota bacterium]
MTLIPRAWSRHRERAVFGLAVLVAVVLAACSSDGPQDVEGNRPTTTTSTVPTTTTTTTRDPQAAAVAAYRAFWQAFLAAADPMNPEDPRLAEHATGEELAAVRKSFLAAKAAGNVIRGNLDLAPRVVSADATTVVLRDCYGDTTGLYNAATGERQDKDDPRRLLVTATVTLVDGVWKVASIKYEGDGCTAS